MSWLRSSPLRQSFTRRNQEIVTTDTRAVIDSFCNHWEQINELIGRSESEVRIKAKQFSNQIVTL